MSEIKKVRQSIMQRKKKRDRDMTSKGIEHKEPEMKVQEEVIATNLADLIPQEEEKHGFVAPVQTSVTKQDKEGNEKKTRISSAFIAKGMLSCCLFTGMFMLVKSETESTARVKHWATNAFSENFQFAKANAWYQNKFGAPLALLPKNPDEQKEAEPQTLPVAGIISESFEANGQGVKITAEKPSDVNAMKKGVVVFAGNNKKTGRTIIVQHEDGSKSIYGNLSKLDVHLYQYVGQNQKIAQFSPKGKEKSVYYSVERNKQYVDPAPVSKVDERP